MRTLCAEIAFDFENENLNEKKLFLDYLTEHNWINLDSERNWKIEFEDDLFDEDQLSFIKEELSLASSMSNLKEVDYAIVMGDLFYFDSIN